MLLLAKWTFRLAVVIFVTAACKREDDAPRRASDPDVESSAAEIPSAVDDPPSSSPIAGPTGDPTNPTNGAPGNTSTHGAIKAISCGNDVTRGSHYCVVTEQGDVKCWGSNSNGQLGIGTVQSSAIGVMVPDLADVRAVTTGGAFSCALTERGKAFCWGLNQSGQLGDGTTDDRLLPTPIANITEGILDIAAGDSHVCAVIVGARVKCWGDNSSGQLGSLGGDGLTPTLVPDLYGVTAIAAGGQHTCAVTNDGLSCWGDNSAGQLGNGDLGDGTIGHASRVVTPTKVTSLTKVVGALDLGRSHTCVLLSDNEVQCFGSNAVGQLGDGKTSYPYVYDAFNSFEIGSSLLPVTPIGMNQDVTHLSVGAAYSCAVQNEGVACWGSNTFGELGDGSAIGAHTNRNTPAPVIGLHDVISLCAGAGACALKKDGSVWCWGSPVYESTPREIFLGAR